MKFLWKTLWEKLHWHTNEFLIRHPALLARTGIPLTVIDRFGSPGDTLLTAVICRELKKRHPGLKINCATPNPSLLELDPNINALNAKPTFCSISFWYLDLLQNKNASTNILKPTMDKLGIRDYQYHAQVYLSQPELESAGKRVEGLSRPIVTINSMSRERVKVWPLEYWREMVHSLRELATVIQLGDSREPEFEGVVRFAGKLSMRESMAVLAYAGLHIGSVSFLMHAANGLHIPSVVIFGGRETPQNSGYAENKNLYTALGCSPCWIHDSHGGKCPYDVKCMDMITPVMVFEAVKEKLGVCKA
jgi:ADP-heptose:LPS heptosyltransferase